jgi:hypothetical protein
MDGIGSFGFGDADAFATQINSGYRQTKRMQGSAVAAITASYINDCCAGIELQFRAQSSQKRLRFGFVAMTIKGVVVCGIEPMRKPILLLHCAKIAIGNVV